MKIAKEFRWEMGHRLPDHFGKCKNIHGHSYKMMVEFEGELDSNGMIIDYYIVKEFIEPIVEKLDHSFMVNKNDGVVLEFLEKLKSKKVIVEFDSTVENITRYLIEEIQKADIPSNVSGIKVRVCETPDDYAEENAQLNNE